MAEPPVWFSLTDTLLGPAVLPLPPSCLPVAHMFPLFVEENCTGTPISQPALKAGLYLVHTHCFFSKHLRQKINNSKTSSSKHGLVSSPQRVFCARNDEPKGFFFIQEFVVIYGTTIQFSLCLAELLHINY